MRGFQPGAFQSNAFQMDAAAQAAGGYGNKPKRRFVVRKDGRLLVFSKIEHAYAALDEADGPQEIAKPVEKKKKATVTPIRAKQKPRSEPEEVAEPQIARLPALAPLQSLDIDAIREMARIRGQARMANEMIRRLQYAALVELALQMQDDEDVEMLLMAA